MNALADRLRISPCGCRQDVVTGIITGFCPTHEATFQTDITTANQLIAEWTQIAKGIALQCKWRPQDKCLVTCQGLAVCNLEGLTLVDEQGQAVERP